MDDSFADCERDADGNILDALTYAPIPDGQVIKLSGVCIDMESLLINAVFSDNITNPYDRQPLLEEVINKLEKFRLKKMITVLILDLRAKKLSKKSQFFLACDYFYLLGDVIVEVARFLGDVTKILELNLRLEGKSCIEFYDKRLDEVSPGNNLLLSLATGTNTANTMKFRQFILSTSRYSSLSFLAVQPAVPPREERRPTDDAREIVARMLRIFDDEQRRREIANRQIRQNQQNQLEQSIAQQRQEIANRARQLQSAPVSAGVRRSPEQPSAPSIRVLSRRERENQNSYRVAVPVRPFDKSERIQRPHQPIFELLYSDDGMPPEILYLGEREHLTQFHAEIRRRPSGRAQPGQQPAIRNLVWYPLEFFQQYNKIIWDVSENSSVGNRMMRGYDWTPMQADLAKLIDLFNLNDSQEENAHAVLLSRDDISENAKRILVANRELPNPRRIVRHLNILSSTGNLMWIPIGFASGRVGEYYFVWDLAPIGTILMIESEYQPTVMDNMLSEAIRRYSGGDRQALSTHMTRGDNVRYSSRLGKAATDRVRLGLSLPDPGNVVPVLNGSEEEITSVVGQFRYSYEGGKLYLKPGNPTVLQQNDYLDGIITKHNQNVERGIDEYSNYPIELNEFASNLLISLIQSGIQLPLSR